MQTFAQLNQADSDVNNVARRVIAEMVSEGKISDNTAIEFYQRLGCVEAVSESPFPVQNLPVIPGPGHHNPHVI